MEEFANTFDTEAKIQTDEDEFDPFGIGDDTGSNANGVSPTEGADEKSFTSSLPPKVVVKFRVEEAVTSNAGNDGSSDVEIEGTVLAQVVSSDATKNIPFSLKPSTDKKVALDFTLNETYKKKVEDEKKEESNSDIAIVEVPKETVEFVKIGTYRISQNMEHMPLLLEQKIVRAKSKIQIAIQVRSKLSNLDDLSEFSIALFIPNKVNAKTVTIATGDGDFDEWKRCITWDKDTLPKGKSFMVSAKCELTDSAKAEDEDLSFPVMLRCRSEDQMSSLKLHAAAAEGHPASISSSVVGKSYRIVHRLK